MLLLDIVGVLVFPCVVFSSIHEELTLIFLMNLTFVFPISCIYKKMGYGCATSCVNSFLLNKTINVLLYVDRLDAYRVDNLDRLFVKAITECFGKGIWNRALVVLTHAQLSPPDGFSYEDFCSKRSGALLKVVHLGAGLKKHDKQVYLERNSQFFFWKLLLMTCFCFAPLLHFH